jgi:hypothetical protein
MQDGVIRFAVNVVLGQLPGKPHFQTLKEAMAASPQIWEYSTQPQFESSP